MSQIESGKNDYGCDEHVIQRPDTQDPAHVESSDVEMAELLLLSK